MKIFLQTQRLTLREFEPTDAELLIELDSDPEVMRYINGGTPTPAQVIREEHLPRMLKYHAAYDHFGIWATHERDSNRFIGWHLLRPAYDIREGMELGYRFKRDAWGKGYATEGSRALLEHAFTTAGLRRVMAMAMKENAASQNVMKKIGMRLVQEGLPADPKVSGPYDVHYAITRDEWKARCAD